MTDRGTFDHRQADFGAGDDAAEREFYEALKRPDPGTDMEEAWPTLADLAEQSEASMMLPIATLVSATLYTAMVFAAGVAWGNRVAACLAIATAGASYLCYLVQVMLGSRRVAEAIMILSIVTGAFAGLSLLAGF